VFVYVLYIEAFIFSFVCSLLPEHVNKHMEHMIEHEQPMPERILSVEILGCTFDWSPGVWVVGSGMQREYCSEISIRGNSNIIWIRANGKFNGIAYFE
jgi:hypothetical protein